MTRITPDWLHDPITERVMAVLATASPHFVGGCVRDALMGRQGGDIDIAVNIPPDQTLKMAEAGGLGAHPTGIDHGVITVAHQGQAFEIASLRRDVATDGRRAVIAFTQNMAEDAARRDFTINALYADKDGRVIDPLGQGIADVENRRIRFIGDATARIREDYLRILRFFRFHAAFGISEFDAHQTAACQREMNGLGQISRERISDEMLKLLGTTNPVPALQAMGDILFLILPGAVINKQLPATEAAMGVAPDPQRRLASLGLPDHAVNIHLRLSKMMARYLSTLQQIRGSTAPLAEIAWRYGGDIARDHAVLSGAAGHPVEPSWREEIARGVAAELPVSAKDFIALGIAPGPGIGTALAAATTAWLQSDFAMLASDLINEGRKVADRKD